jgi:hypothetical protein
MNDPTPLLTVEQLGDLKPCEHCHKPTYLRSALPASPTGIVDLPDGFTRGNARHFVTVHGQHLTVCETCRYDVYGAY